MSGFSNLWCVNDLRVRGWPGLRFIRDASFHCLETAAVVLFTIILLPVSLMDFRELSAWSLVTQLGSGTV